jgi:hypothetical protein
MQCITLFHLSDAAIYCYSALIPVEVDTVSYFCGRTNGKLYDRSN